MLNFDRLNVCQKFVYIYSFYSTIFIFVITFKENFIFIIFIQNFQSFSLFLEKINIYFFFTHFFISLAY